MRYAIFSDVHAYPQSLERVLEDATSQQVDARMCLGDVVGYGPDPVGAVKLCRERCDVVVSGNHDAAVAQQISTAFFIPRAQRAVARHQGLLDAADVKWLSRLPMSRVQDGFAMVHGELHRRLRRFEAGFGYVISAEDAERTLDALPSRIQLAFVGHTHAACIWRVTDDRTSLLPPNDFAVEPDVRYVVNVGAVGYPRYSLATDYVIYDSVARTVAFRRLPFDFKDYSEQMKRAEVAPPSWLIDHLRTMKNG